MLATRPKNSCMIFFFLSNIYSSTLEDSQQKNGQLSAAATTKLPGQCHEKFTL